MSDFLRDQTGGELAGWRAYLRVDDEVQTQRTGIAILKALSRLPVNQPARQSVEEDEKPIDTTAPGFADTFKGFIGAPGQRR